MTRVRIWALTAAASLAFSLPGLSWGQTPPPSEPPPSPPASPHAQAFLKKAIMGDESEILLGKLAETRGAAIKDFAVALVQDHIQARDQADQLARSEGMTPPTQPTPAAKRELAKLQGLSGPGFDYEFVHYEIKDHRRDIRAYRRAAAKGGPVGDLAHATLPVLQKHLRMAVGLAQQGA